MRIEIAGAEAGLKSLKAKALLAYLAVRAGQAVPRGVLAELLWGDRSETQARAILDLRLQRLTQIGVKEVTDELEELAGKITDYLEILGSRVRIMSIISDELREVRELW